MIANFSSLDLYEQCKHKWWLRHVKRLGPPPQLTLERGSGGHLGLKHFHKTHDIHASVELAEQTIRKQMEDAHILYEERPEWERAIVSAREGIRQWGANYSRLNYQVIRGEVKFRVAISNTEHHCPFFHEILHPNEPHFECPDPACMRNHYLTGYTDAIVSLDNNFWILDFKFSGFRPELFFKTFQLDMQGTIYCYGVHAATGITPKGFIINKFNMPWKNQAADKVTIESEGYLREHQDFQRMLDWTTDIVTDLESKYTGAESKHSHLFRMNPRSCYDYQRECWFHNVCMNHDEPESMEDFQQAPNRYHEDDYYHILLEERVLRTPWQDLPETVRNTIHTEGLEEYDSKVSNTR